MAGVRIHLLAGRLGVTKALTGKKCGELSIRGGVR
jgi:hypothetical protein